MSANGREGAAVAVRLSDVALRAGVSVKTVSNVVHGYVHVRPETPARVQAALDELNYRPNLSARSLRQGRSGLIALAVPALDMPYFAELAQIVVDAADERGWTVLVDQTSGDPQREREVASGLRGHLIDGLILSPVALEADELARTPGETPLVLLGERIAGGPLDHVAVDNVAAARAATEHLLGLGRRRVAAIGYQSRQHSSSGVAALRRRGYEEALAAAGLGVDPSLAPRVTDYRRSDGAEAMASLLDLTDPPDAVFCFNDPLALGAMRLLGDRGMRVPEDVAVIGFDDIEDGRYSMPSLSTVAPGKRSIGRTAVEMLDERISRRSDLSPRDVRVEFEVLARESTLGRGGT
jgi:DNA-binding LacI/PurR family transcriptional regulator